jgi:hypothetical protein
MKKSKLIITMIAAVCAVAFVGSVVLAEGGKAPEEVYKDTYKADITMNSAVFAKHTKAPVNFPHAKHATEFKLDCAECHHTMVEGENTWKMGDEVGKCGSCHDKDGKPAKDAEDASSYLYEAMHGMCVDCHKAYKKENKETSAPTLCTKCHIKVKE